MRLDEQVPPMFRRRAILAFALFSTALLGQRNKYTGPEPRVADVPYLMHADNLVETEKGMASESARKNDSVYTVKGAASPARTPLAEPIFLIKSDRLDPNKLQLYRTEVRNGQREVVVSRRGGSRPLHLSVQHLGGNLYRVEAAQILENGEYCLTPDGSNDVFCFQVY
jgi:hypothetical protein